MRTTIDIPEPLFRQTKAMAAIEGVSLREIVIRAITQLQTSAPAAPDEPVPVRQFPSFHLRSGRKLDLSDFDFDELLG